MINNHRNLSTHDESRAGADERNDSRASASCQIAPPTSVWAKISATAECGCGCGLHGAGWRRCGASLSLLFPPRPPPHGGSRSAAGAIRLCSETVARKTPPRREKNIPIGGSRFSSDSLGIAPGGWMRSGIAGEEDGGGCKGQGGEAMANRDGRRFALGSPKRERVRVGGPWPPKAPRSGPLRCTCHVQHTHQIQHFGRSRHVVMGSCSPGDGTSVLLYFCTSVHGHAGKVHSAARSCRAGTTYKHEETAKSSK